MTGTVTWETWSAAEQQWKAAHPIAGRGKGWRQSMLGEISEQFGGAHRPEPPRDPYEFPECSFCHVELEDADCADGCDAGVCPACGRVFHQTSCRP